MKNIILRVFKSRRLTVISLLIIITIGYFGYRAVFGKNQNVRYVFVQAQKGTLITSISGNGQINAINQINVKPKTSGEIISVNVVAGQKIKAGAILAYIDSTDAQKAVRDAKLNLDSAKLAFKSADNDFKKTFDQALNYIDSTISDATTAMLGLHDILFSDAIGGNSQINFNIYITAENFNSASGKYNNYDKYYNAYQNAKNSYQKALENYKSIDRNSLNASSVVSLLSDAYDALKLISETSKNTSNLLDDYRKKVIANNQTLDSNTITYISDISTYQNTINNDITNILSSKNSISSENGDPIAIQSQQISLKQKENALLDAQSELSNYYIRAPFNGTVATVDVEKGDLASSATAVATIITESKNVEISLSEVDAAKIKIGQKANLTFDAIPDLNITGKVAELDSVGTVSQGVVTYNAKISLDIQDERIKPEMTVSANIITDSKTDVLMIPNSAVKQQNGNYYVLIPNENVGMASSSGAILKKSPLQKQIEIGSANDGYTEVTNGLNEGDEIISRTITSSTKTQSPQSGSNALRGIGGGFGR